MKSIKNHLSLVIALVSILFSMQLYLVIERSIKAYTVNLANNYAVIVLSKKEISKDEFVSCNALVIDVEQLNSDEVVDRLSSGMKNSNVEYIKLTLPKFYKLILREYPSPDDILKLKKSLQNLKDIVKIEDFAQNHDLVYKMLLLFNKVSLMFATVILVVTLLLIFKELKIWQYKHNQRMSVMALFGAPLWLRSAVLFRLAIADAIISSVITIGLFFYISTNYWIKEQFREIGIDVNIFDLLNDSILVFGVAIGISIVLAILIVLGHREEDEV